MPFEFVFEFIEKCVYLYNFYSCARTTFKLSNLTNWKHWVDFTETYSAVDTASTIKVILIMHRWLIKQVDVSNTFLSGYLNGNLYMAQPEWFVDQATPDYVCKLQKALYGLNLASTISTVW